MKDKKYKYYEDLVEEYLLLSDENVEIPGLIEKHKEKLDILIADKISTTLKSGDTNDAYKLFLQIKKLEDRKIEVQDELDDVQTLLKDFLKYLDGCKITFKERDDEDKTKVTYSFWIEDGVIKSNR